MKKRILTCMRVISVMLFTGCGISYSDLTKEIGCGAPYPVDDSEKDKNGNDAEEYVNRMEDPENYGIGSVTAYSTYIGWQFEDYGIVIIVSETSDSGAGSLRVNIQDVTISYVPITYGTLEDVFGSNAVSDFIAAK